jgi:hypothetical protein
MANNTNRSNVLLNVEVCGDGDEANNGSGGEGHPRGVQEITSLGTEVVARKQREGPSTLKSPLSMDE